MNDKDNLLTTLIPFLMMIEMAVTGPGQGVPLVSLSRVMRTTTMSAEIRARLQRPGKQRYEQGVKTNFQITFHTQN